MNLKSTGEASGSNIRTLLSWIERGDPELEILPAFFSTVARAFAPSVFFFRVSSGRRKTWSADWCWCLGADVQGFAAVFTQRRLKNARPQRSRQRGDPSLHSVLEPSPLFSQNKPAETVFLAALACASWVQWLVFGCFIRFLKKGG